MANQMPTPVSPPEDHGQEQKELGVFSGVGQDIGRVLPQPLHFGQYQKQPAAHGKMGDIDMDDGDDGDEQAAAEGIQVPDGIVHGCTSLSAELVVGLAAGRTSLIMYQIR